MAGAMGTSAALEAHKADPVPNALRVASQMLHATHKALQSLEQHPEGPAANPKFLAFLHLQVGQATSVSSRHVYPHPSSHFLALRPACVHLCKD